MMGGHAHDRSRGQFSEAGFTPQVGDPGHFITDLNDPNAGFLSPVADNFFNVPGGYKIGGPNSASVLATLFPPYGFDGTYRQYFIDGSANTTIAQLAAGPLQLSIGAERVMSRWCSGPRRTWSSRTSSASRADPGQRVQYERPIIAQNAA